MEELNYPWKHTRRFNDYSSYIKRNFSSRIQKISIDAGFTCPNRDGTKGRGGCIYCYNKTFNPGYCKPEKSITEQIDQGVAFFKKKYPAMKYFAYFQAYTNTYEKMDVLSARYHEALSHPEVIGLIIGTRPDCVNDEVFDLIKDLDKEHYVVIEYGVESCLDKTLELLNRGHSYKDAADAILKANAWRIKCGVHMIIGLPGESRTDILNHATKLSGLPVHTIKLHQLQVIKGTKLGEMFQQNPEIINKPNLDEYIELVIDFVERLNPAFIIERFISFSPPDLILAPRWNKLKNFEIVDKIEKRMEERGTWQGRLFKENI